MLLSGPKVEDRRGLPGALGIHPQRPYLLFCGEHHMNESSAHRGNLRQLELCTELLALRQDATYDITKFEVGSLSAASFAHCTPSIGLAATAGVGTSGS